MSSDQEVAGPILVMSGIIYREIYSTVILPLLLIHEGQLSFSGERMCTRIGNRIEDMPLQEKASLRKHAYSNILKILPPKNENFQIKKI